MLVRICSLIIFFALGCLNTANPNSDDDDSSSGGRANINGGHQGDAGTQQPPAGTPDAGTQQPPAGFFCGDGDVDPGENGECIYIDLSAGLDWQGCVAGQTGEDCTGTPERKNHADALTYCENLLWGGFDDWVLPNIDELRSLIRGCAKNEYGSSECPINHQCSYSTNNENTCGANYCSDCDNWGGPGSDGCYWPADLPGECYWLWSSSLQSASATYGVSFLGGLVYYYDLPANGQVRCVRSRP